MSESEMWDEYIPPELDVVTVSKEPAYRNESPGPGVRLPSISETPIGQTELFSGMAAEQAAHSALLTDRFVVPPFSVLDGRAGYWQDRRAQWLALGIQSEIGRDEDLLFRGAVRDLDYMRRREGTRGEAPDKLRSGASIFDPVLCEIAYRWFSPPRGSVLDPFAGGSVRGVVASMLGHRYTGIDLSSEQVEANRVQAESILAEGDYPPPVWIQGDSAYLTRLLTEARQYDLLFSCPPYYDLEVYGDQPGELSAMQTYEEFLRAYRLIISLAAERLKPDRFAVWVVGEIRDRAGWQRGFVTDTVLAFRDAGLQLYNEAVLINQVATTAMRAPRQFALSRKLGRTHQAVLVFHKGASLPRWGIAA